MIRNKVDLTEEPIGVDAHAQAPVYRLSAKSQKGLDALKQHLERLYGISRDNRKPV